MNSTLPLVILPLKKKKYGPTSQKKKITARPCKGLQRSLLLSVCPSLASGTQFTLGSLTTFFEILGTISVYIDTEKPKNNHRQFSLPWAQEVRSESQQAQEHVGRTRGAEKLWLMLTLGLKTALWMGQADGLGSDSANN